VLPFGAPIRLRMKVKSGHYNGLVTCRTAFVIPDHKAILLLLLFVVYTYTLVHSTLSVCRLQVGWLVGWLVGV